MKTLFAILFLCIASVSRGATGDISAATVLADGWEIELTFEGFTTGATFAFGFTGNNIPSASTPYLTVVSEGYDATGALGTITRTVYLTKNVRKVYPDEATANQTGTSPMTARFALSDYVYLDDNTGAGKSGTAPTITIPAAFCTNAGGASQTSNALTAAAVTNNSTAVYPKVVANWSRPGYQRVTGNFDLAAVAFHGHGMNGKPVACVKFTATDTSANVATTIVTAPTIDSTQGDAVPVVEYIGTMSVSSLTALQVLTCQFIAYPWIGDAASILDTSAGTAAPTPLYGPITMLNDKSNTYGVTVAYVASGGSDAGANTAYDIASYPGDATAYKFATINGALLAIKNYNNTNRSRSNVGGGIVYLADGTWTWVGGSSSYTTVADTWVTVMRSPSSTNQSSVIIGGASGNSAINGKVKIYDVKITATSNLIFNGLGSFWIDRCTIDQTGVAGGFAMIYGATTVWLTANTIPVLHQGLRPSSTQNTPFALIRGNTLDLSGNGGSFSIFCYTTIGNLRTGSASWEGEMLDNYTSMTIPAADNNIIAFNRMLNCGNVVYNNNTTAKTGFALVQNVFENVDNGSGSAYQISIAGDSSTGTNAFNNVIIWNNTVVGMRFNAGYNDNGSSAPERRYWSVKNNLADDWNIKSDTFGTQNAARISGWSQLHSVNYSGNIFAQVTSIGASGLNGDFVGLNCIESDGVAATYMGYTNRLAWAGGADTAGLGTYTLTSSSPAKTMQRDFVMPYDIAGTARAASDAAGAYHYGSFSAFKTGGLNW